MQLKRIELEGFKSFADRTVIHVERGLTGIVGPNGCGKSNVVDALLWVMGERSAKTLRADSMDDVIFKGAEGRAAAPYAMVEIILLDDTGMVEEAGSELAVGRRLFSTGESEYLLNGRKSKRKEVRELLMDTGLGVRSYMVLAQGKIDAVLSANPADRRSVFEEAAGISRYKSRKHEAELKLARVDRDLERVDDVYKEVQRAVRSLKYQAGKAERYIETRDAYRASKVRLHWIDSARLQGEELGLKTRSGELENEISEVKERRDSSESQLKLLGEESNTLRERHDSLRTESGELRQNAATLEERVRGWDGQASELLSRREREQERLSSLRNEDVGREEADSSLVNELDGLSASRDAVAKALELAEAEFNSAKQAHREVRERVETLRAGTLQALGERSQFNNQTAAAASRRSEAQGVLRSVERRTNDRESEFAKLQELFELASKEAEQLRAVANAGEGRSRKLLDDLETTRQAVAEANSQLEQAQRQFAGARARLQALDAVEQDMQGLPEQVREQLAENQSVNLLLEGVEIDSPWDRLLENLLGRLQHSLWVDDREQAFAIDAAVDCFFPVDRSTEMKTIDGAKALSEVVSGSEQQCRAICSRLGAIYCVETAELAANLAQQHRQFMFLAANGEMHAHGYFRRGMLSDGSEGLLARRNARAEAEQLEKSAITQLEKYRQIESTSKELAASLTKEIKQLDSELREAVAKRDRADARLSDIEGRQKTGQEESAALATEREQAEAALAQASKEEGEFAQMRDAAEEKRERLNQELADEEQSGGHLDQAFDLSRQALQEARLEKERHLQRCAHVEEKLQAHRRLHERDQIEGARIEEELTKLQQRADETVAQSEQGRDELRKLLATRGEFEVRVQEAQVQAERAAAVLLRERANVDGGSGHFEKLLEERQSLALGIQRVQLRREELVRTLLEEFQQPLEDLAQSFGLSADDAQMEDEAFTQLESEVNKLRSTLERIGSVNLDAVAELSERQEREDFLAKERKDLVEAKQNLFDTIESLDVRCRDRFLEVFNSVQGEFEGIFRRLFRGGKAELILEENADPLTAGIEISARPPGKELRSLKLLSGGEKTLTALALLLAVFRSKPSPFCLLDEVDAALDDANVGRFLDVVDDFIGETQFLVVTHNKITMARCQRLFGVTMRKAGVSMVVAVDLLKISENEDGTIASLSSEDKPRIITTKQDCLPTMDQRNVADPAVPTDQEAGA